MAVVEGRATAANNGFSPSLLSLWHRYHLWRRTRLSVGRRSYAGPGKGFTKEEQGVCGNDQGLQYRRRKSPPKWGVCRVATRGQRDGEACGVEGDLPERYVICRFRPSFFLPLSLLCGNLHLLLRYVIEGLARGERFRTIPPFHEKRTLAAPRGRGGEIRTRSGSQWRST